MEWWQNIQQFFSENPDIWWFLVIPVLAAIIGWGTNILAIKMTFYPIEFYGFKVKQMVEPVGFKREGITQIGWQGLIPAKAHHMAEVAVELITSKLINVEEQFGKIDPDLVAEEMAPHLEALSREIIEEAMAESFPLIWNNLPKSRKNKIFDSAEKAFPEVIRDIMTDIKENINDVLDLKKLVVHELVSDKRLLNQIFLRCGAKEFKFIERSGFYFGFLFGLVQMVIWYFFPYWWILPVGGVVVGWLTNKLALKLIFEPKNPIKIGPVVIQGLFMKRQMEVAAEYAKIVAQNIITSKNVFLTIFKGHGAEKLVGVVREHVREGVDKAAGFNRSLIQLATGTKKYEAVKEIACERFVKELPNSITHMFDYAEEALDVENTLRDKMQELSPEEFEGVLRPAYQQDEWKLILTGAILGGVAGCLQIPFLI